MAAYVGWSAIRENLIPATIATAFECFVMLLTVWWCSIGLNQTAAVFAYTQISALWFSSAGSCFVCAVLIVCTANSSGFIGRALSWRPFIWLGEISFALYMVHQPLMKWMQLGKWASYSILNRPFVVLSVCILCTALLHHIVEKPMPLVISGRVGAGDPLR